MQLCFSINKYINGGVVVKIHQSEEDYLEAILILKDKSGAVRSIDIANHMNYTKPSVSRAVGLLRSGGKITIDKDGFIEFTPTGRAVAERIYERHTLMTKWLVMLGVSQATAAEDACRIEHDISEETFEKIREHTIRFSK